MATVRYQSVSIRLRGSDIEDRNSAAKKSGNTPCTASPLPVRSATNAPMQPNASEIVSESRISTGTPPGPAASPSPNTMPTSRKVAAWISPSARMPVSWPSMSATRRSGVSDSRFRKPVSMSFATFVPALMAEKSAPWMNGMAIANWK